MGMTKEAMEVVWLRFSDTRKKELDQIYCIQRVRRCIRVERPLDIRNLSAHGKSHCTEVSPCYSLSIWALRRKRCSKSTVCDGSTDQRNKTSPCRPANLYLGSRLST